MRFISKWICEIILIILTSYFIYFKSDYNPWNRMIFGDGSGYYAYLPAVFIYHDLSYGFKSAVEEKYYPPQFYNHYINEVEGKKVNKFSVGLSILWLPFFITAHFLSYLFQLPTDGYSVMYQFAIGLSCILYLYFTLKLLSKLLTRFNFNKDVVALTILMIALGTNVFYYTIYDPSLTHIYNFFLISFMFERILLFNETSNLKNVFILSIALGLIIVVRPINIISLLAIPFLFNDFSSFRSLLVNFITSKKILLLAISAALLPILLQIYLWKIQTGYLIIDTYVGEHFNFNNPEVLNLLFSFKKGWFIYTPIAFLSMLGFISMYKLNKYRFIVLLLFLVFSIYVLSSWWSWWYGWGFSIRPLIDFYCLIAVLLAYSFNIFYSNKIKFRFYTVLLFSLLIINLIQSYQHRMGILPGEGPSKQEYFHTFMRIY